MSPEAVERRLRAANPPDLEPVHRLHHKLDMSAIGVEVRLRQVASMWRLGRWLTSRAELSPPTTPDAPRR